MKRLWSVTRKPLSNLINYLVKTVPPLPPRIHSMAVPYIKMGKKIKAADSLVKASEIFKKSMGGFLLPKAGRLLLMQAGFLYSDSGSYRKAWQILIKAEKRSSKFFF